MQQLDNTDFILNHWKLDLSLIPDIPPNSVALTVNSATQYQAKKIKTWCKRNGNYTIYPTELWTDHTVIPTNAHYSYVKYRNNERTIIGTESEIEKLEKYLDSIVLKSSAFLVNAAELADITSRFPVKDVRVLSNLNDSQTNIIITSNKDLIVECTLRCG